MAQTTIGFRELVERLGPHPAFALGLDLDAPEGPERWLVAACLLAGRGSEAHRLEAARRLAEAGLDRPSLLTGDTAEQLEATLTAAKLSDAQAMAQRLVRSGARLRERHGGSLARLAAEADGLEELGARLAGLAPGIGVATVLRFLRPLRRRWPAAADVPLTAAARAAALHLGWLAEGEDEQGAPGALAARLREAGDTVSLTDVEAALERLGARACLRARSERCPLGPDCPGQR
jgi:hypothetical protein